MRTYKDEIKSMESAAKVLRHAARRMEAAAIALGDNAPPSDITAALLVGQARGRAGDGLNIIRAVEEKLPKCPGDETDRRHERDHRLGDEK